MSAIDSPFYPPRAGWWSRRLNGWHRLRRRMESTRFTPEGAPSRGRLLVWLLVPGAVYFSRARDLHGVACGAILLLGWLAALAIHFIWIGLPWATLAFILLSAFHSISATAALQQAAPRAEPHRLRAVLGGCLVALAFSFLLRTQVADRIVLPIEVRGKSVLIDVRRSTASIERGEWVAHREAWYEGFDQVLAVPGDTVRFQRDAVVVNGIAYRRSSALMPESGEWVVPHDCYFIWPAGLTVWWARHLEPDRLMEYSFVKKAEVIGPAYRRWLWRKPVLEPLVPLKNWTPPSPAP